MKKVIVFDLDGTLAEAKQSIDSETSALLSNLLYVKKVGIVSGGDIAQIQKQVVAKLSFDKSTFKNLFIFPTKGAMMYTFNGKEWLQVYQRALSLSDKKKIKSAFAQVIKQVDFLPTKHYGEILEDRETQLSFSALGQDAPVELKKKWDPDIKKRQQLRKLLEQYIPEFEIEIGGNTSIDVTEKNIDKAFALEQLCKYEHVTIPEILFIGDGLFPNGNDYAVIKTGVDTIRVNDYNETKGIIKNIIEENI